MGYHSIMEPLIAQLKKLNLTDKEARVYLSLLELGPSTPYRIAKRARLKRPTAYVIAEELIEKGLIIQVTGEKKKLYMARSPETYFEEAEHKLRDAKRVLPELLALQKKTSEKPTILYFEGTEGVKQAYEYRLKEFHGKEIVGFFARLDEVDEEMHREVFFPWNEYKNKNNINVRGYTVDDPKLVPYAKFLREGGGITAKYLPESLYSADCSVEIFDFGVRIVIMQSKQALIVESEKLAIALRQIFELLWEKTKGEYDSPQQIPLS